jgi:tetratricopeptide (TPR) repeat protein
LAIEERQIGDEWLFGFKSGDMAEKKVDMESFLSRAKEQEKKYDWIGAAESYGKALDLVSVNNLIEAGEILEKQGFSLYKAAMQSEGNNQLRELTQKAIDCYVKAKANYGKSPESERIPFQTRSNAMIAFLRYWQTSDATEKKELVMEAWQEAINAMKGFEESASSFEYVRTYNQLTLSAVIAYQYAVSFDSENALIQSGANCGEKAVEMLSTQAEPNELAKAYVNTCAFLTALAKDSGNSSDSHQCDKRAMTCWQNAVQCSEESALTELTSMLLLGDLPSPFQRDQSMNVLQKALGFGRSTHDRLLVGSVLGALAGRASWGTLSAGDSDECDRLSQKALEFAAEANKEFSRIAFLPPGSHWEMWVAAPDASVYGVLAYHENDSKKKREYAEKAVKSYSSALELAQNSGYPYLISYIQHRLGYSLTSLAKTESVKSRKKDLLEQAIEMRKLSAAATNEFEPFTYWSRGTDQSLLAEAEFELANLVDDPSDKRDMLHKAVSRKKGSLELHFKAMSVTSPDAPEELLTNYPIVGHWLLQYSEWLEALYELEGDKSDLRTARDALVRAAEMFSLGGVASRAAECQWKAAQTCDGLQEYKRGAECFLIASDRFKTAAEKTLQLRAMFEEHAQYMRAWTAIENAKYFHSMDDPASASRYYDEAAQSHKSTKTWGYLSDVYSGLAKAEHAEDLSRKETYRDAMESFELAARLFIGAKTTLQNQVSRIESVEEKKMVTGVAMDLDRRIAFCRARTSLEEARLLEMRGELAASSEKYSLAASSFQKMLDNVGSAEDKRPLELIISLASAWQAMVRAESEASPESYGKAAEHFDHAKELAVGEKMKVMATGNGHFCRALEAGARFADTGELSLHSIATKHLESAAKYYLRADLENAAEYAKASKLLFDGYAYMDKASTEENQEKKAKLYAMAEKVLQLSAASYEKAAQPSRRDQVSKLLRKVVEDRELAIALTDVLLAPDIASTAMALSSPAPTHETAVGLERFEHADVQASLVAKPKDLHVGQELVLEIELVNAGRGPAQLTRVEGTVPKGFVIVQEPEKYRMEDSQINLKGRRLDALKTEDVKLVLKPTAKGNFKLKPRIMYLDESGANRSCEPIPVDVAVREMGISGWIRGT